MKIRNSLIIIIFLFISYVLLINHSQHEKSHSIPVVEKYNQYVIQNSIISINHLVTQIDNSDIKLLFIQSNGLPNSFIPKTSIIHYNQIINVKSDVPYIATKEQMDKVLSQAGVKDDDVLVLYDVNNSPYVARLFWTLKVYGHDFVKILNGGLNEWRKAGYSTISYPIKPQPSVISAHELNHSMIATLENIKEAILNDDVILDVRTEEEYHNGHIPTAINIPYDKALDQNGLFKTYAALQKVYHPDGVTPERSAIYVYCSTGNRSSFTYFVLHELLGYNNVKVYDGSYKEYLKTGLPIET